MKRSGAIYLLILSALLVAFLLTSCTQIDRKSTDEAQKKILNTSFPSKTFIHDYEVRFVPRKITYPKALPTLSARNEDFTDKEILGWFTANGGSVVPKADTDKPVSSFGSGAGHGVSLSATSKPKAWDITGEETGTLFIDEGGGISFYNPKEIRSYGVLPKGAINPGIKIVFARDMIAKKNAVEKAEAYVQLHGGVPEDARKKVIPGDSGIRIVKDGKLIDPVGKTLWYSVKFEHRHKGILIEPDNIEINVDALGVPRYTRSWHKVRANGKPIDIISPEKAAAVAVAHYAPRIYSRYGIVVSQIRLVYYSPPQVNRVDNSPPVGKLRPAWRFRITGEDAIVDAHTGELQGVDWEPGVEPTVTKAMKKFENNPLSDRIPVPRRISFIDGGKEVWHINPTDAEFGPIFKEAQEVLSKMRPYYNKKKANVTGVSSEGPQDISDGGLLLQYGGKERLVTDSKIGRDIDKKDLPTGEKERRMNYTKDGYYRLYARDVFICFNESRTEGHAKRGTPEAIYEDLPFTKILTTTRGYKYFFTYALASNDELIKMTYKQAGSYTPMRARSFP